MCAFSGLVIELHLIPEFPEQSRQIANDIANIINNKDTELKNKEFIQNKEAIRAASDRAFSGFGGKLNMNMIAKILSKL